MPRRPRLLGNSQTAQPAHSHNEEGSRRVVFSDESDADASNEELTYSGASPEDLLEQDAPEQDISQRQKMPLPHGVARCAKAAHGMLMQGL